MNEFQRYLELYAIDPISLSVEAEEMHRAKSKRGEI